MIAGKITLFGIGAFVGLAIGGRASDRYPFSTLVMGISGLVMTSAAIALLSSYLMTTIVLVFLLGVFGFLLNPAVWGRVYAVASDAPMLAGATNSSAFQAGLTLAPLLAGLPVSLGYGLSAVGWVGAALGGAALGLAVLDMKLNQR
ncbi:hypothetical protein [Yersinia kristensenii]|uniref:hypothetical protein n=1 Tax=Yersinia kristensenii TaxID=28152 RepID=UPI001C6101B1|nr:hypothetical protein [Yersinia kristensenii]MBW5811996.1 hypothetical protein [Yersinia kristensenii]MBW5829536.1 hypothetical protein [Yersinia kristensenii]